MIKPDIILKLEEHASYKCDKGCIYNHPAGTFIIKYLITKDGTVSHTIQFKMESSLLWTLGDINDFLSIYHTDIRVDMLSERRYGEPKLSKPVEIKDICQAFSIPYVYGRQNNVKASNLIYIKGDDIFMKIRDYNSQLFRPHPEFRNAPLSVIVERYFPEKSVRQKFIYNDCWGSVVLRGEAWMCFRHIIPLIKKADLLVSLNVLINLSREFPYLDSREWHFCCENLINQIKNECLPTKEL